MMSLGQTPKITHDDSKGRNKAWALFLSGP
jgi:hypothetical protein